ncbi:MAG: Na+/H+ antiporter subunit E [Betaproteobacteria bacterium]
MRRLVPAPLVSLALLATWLALHPHFGPGHLALGTLLTIAVPLLTAPLRPATPRLRRPAVAAALVVRVARDVVRSNFDVCRTLWRGAQPRSAFVRIPLDLRDANGLAALAMITTVVPGTVWAELALDRATLLVHVFDLDDESAFVARYKACYEQPLREIFE